MSVIYVFYSILSTKYIPLADGIGPASMILFILDIVLLGPTSHTYG
jgi:hypothetical protein